MNLIINNDFRNEIIPKGLIITDPPYNQGYSYNNYKDSLSESEYILLLSKIPLPCVIIHYPEETINILPKAFDTGKQSRLISFWGCKPDFGKLRQPYKNLKDKRIIKRMSEGKTGAKIYDWWEVQQVKNVSKEKTDHPCQIPEEIIKRIITITAKPDDLIIDIFSGSGTTLKVAKDMGFNFLGYEVDKEYCNIIKKRLNAEETN